MVHLKHGTDERLCTDELVLDLFFSSHRLGAVQSLSHMNRSALASSRRPWRFYRRRESVGLSYGRPASSGGGWPAPCAQAASTPSSTQRRPPVPPWRPPPSARAISSSFIAPHSWSHNAGVVRPRDTSPFSSCCSSTRYLFAEILILPITLAFDCPWLIIYPKLLHYQVLRHSTASSRDAGTKNSPAGRGR